MIKQRPKVWGAVLFGQPWPASSGEVCKLHRPGSCHHDTPANYYAVADGHFLHRDFNIIFLLHKYAVLQPRCSQAGFDRLTLTAFDLSKQGSKFFCQPELVEGG